MASSVFAVSSWFISVSFRPNAFLQYVDLVAVYPETMGVPLEEMDAVFGEGRSTLSFQQIRLLTSWQTSWRKLSRTNLNVLLWLGAPDPDPLIISQSAHPGGRAVLLSKAGLVGLLVVTAKPTTSPLEKKNRN